ncbi:unnamed protein product [Urochloa decumbens]|uniref:Cathepsin propeptide inhibitor domain-containing protein n=1 Tax=Urochloa decumbens TaxID=240449 RepID=A0ABC9DC34_9POAL
MALRSLGSLVRGAIRARARSSSPGIAVHQGAPLRSAAGSEAEAHALHGLRNLSYHVDAARPVPAAAAVSASARARGLHSSRGFFTAQSDRAGAGYSSPRIIVQASSTGSVPGKKGARRFYSLRDLAAAHPRGAHAALTVAAFSACAGIWYMNMIHTDEPSGSDEARAEEDMEEDMEEDDPILRTDAYRRYKQALEDMEREMESYNKPLPDKNDVVTLDQEDMKDEEAMRARFEDWMKEFGRAYRDEEEKERRFRIFKATARFVDVANAVAGELESDVCMGLDDFADWNMEEFLARYGHMSDDEYLTMMDVNDASDDNKTTKQKLQQQESKD